MKACIRCKKEKEHDEFCRRNSAKDGRDNVCKKCKSIIGKTYREKNKEKEIARGRKYRNENRDKEIECQKKYYEENKDKVNAKHRGYDKLNKELIKERKDKYYKNNAHLPSNSKTLFSQLLSIDEPVMTDGTITVACKNCRKRIVPSANKIKSRICSIVGSRSGESSFYCSDRCKDDCPTYNHKSNTIDPRSKLYVGKSEQEKARACQTKSISEIQCDSDGKMHCEKCGREIFDIDKELHHTLLISEHGMDAVNASTQILACIYCHLEIHETC